MNKRAIDCRYCGQSFKSDVRAGTPPAYCSDACRRKMTWQKRQEKRQSLAELRCPRCGEMKPIGDFSAATQSYCRPCHAAYARLLRANKSPQQKARARLVDSAWRNGVTAEQLLALVDAQSGLCAICKSNLNGDSRRWHIDHDHKCCTGTSGDHRGPRQRSCGKCIRGILCGNCNVGLGMFRDDPEILRAALRYLATARVS
jgi:hypothetical protein